MAPTQAGIWSFELDARWDRIASDREFSERRADLEKRATSLEALAESRLINDLLSGLLLHKNIVEQSDPRTGPVARTLEDALCSIEAFQHLARKINPQDSSIAYGHWAMANLCRAARQREALAQFLHRANQAYSEASDRIGMALAVGRYYRRAFQSPGGMGFCHS
jgi:hypothetical protein